MSKRVVFVINPNSGSDRKTDRVKFIETHVSDNYESEILFWEHIHEKDQIFERVRTGGFDIAVAVGGDGTVSQLAENLCGTDIALGIIPFGSGNGLARHLQIPVNRIAAMKLLETAVTIKIDCGKINDHFFFCTAGVGFDARIGKLFAESTDRGFMTYAKITLREIRHFKPEKFSIEVDDQKMERDAILVTIANAGQYGNNAWIAPSANVRDGLLHVSVLKPFPLWKMPRLITRLFLRKLEKSDALDSFSGKKIVIRRKEEGPMHYDGEPAYTGKEIEARIMPLQLNVLVNQGFTG
jgi:diacylglycerol kinase (ATP)